MDTITALVQHYFDSNDWRIGFSDPADPWEMASMAPEVVKDCFFVLNAWNIALVHRNDFTQDAHELAINTHGNEAWAPKNGQALPNGWTLKAAAPAPSNPDQMTLTV